MILSLYCEALHSLRTVVFSDTLPKYRMNIWLDCHAYGL